MGLKQFDQHSLNAFKSTRPIMKKILSTALCFLAFFSTPVHAQEQMTADRFKELVSTPGDNTPLSARLSVISTLWTNAEVSVHIKYQDGRTFQEVVPRTA